MKASVSSVAAIAIGLAASSLWGCSAKVGSHDGGGGAGDAGGASSIAGATQLAVTVESGEPATPLAGASVLVEVPGGDSLEATTDSDGKATIGVNFDQGPFDVTVAKNDLGAVSVLGVTQASDLDKPFVVPGPPVVTATFDLTGTISGKASPDNLLLIDGTNVGTVVLPANTTSYTTKYSTFAGETRPFHVSVLEIDATSGDLVNAALSAPQTRTGAAMAVDVTLPATANVPTHQTITIQLPSTGLVPAASVKPLAPLNAALPGLPAKYNVPVLKTFTGLPSGSWVGGDTNMVLVGLGSLAAPSGGTAQLDLQFFGGDLAPETAYMEFVSTASTAVASYAWIRDFTASTVTVDPVDELSVSGTTLDTVTLQASSPAGNWLEADIGSWFILSTATSLTDRGLPNLPSAVTLSSFNKSSIVDVYFYAMKLAAQPAWWGYTNGIFWPAWHYGTGRGVNDSGR